MSRRFKTFSRKLISWLTGVTMIAGMMVITMPVASAAAATSVVVTAKFGSAGPAALDNNILVTFTEPVCGDADCSEALSISNFVYTDGSGTAQTISTVTHTAGTTWALLDMSSALDAGDAPASTIRVEEVYTASGMVKEDSALTVALSTDSTAPTISTKGIKDGVDALLLIFSEPVGDEGGAVLVKADFTYVDANVGTAAAFGNEAIHDASRTSVIFDLNANMDAADHADGTDDAITIADDKLYDLVGNEIASPAPTAEIDLSTFTADSTAPAISVGYGRLGADTTGGNDLVVVGFSEPVFNASTHTGALEAADFVYGSGSNAIDGITHTAGNDFLGISLTTPLTAFTTIDTETAAGGDNDVFDTFGNALLSATAGVTVTDNTFPVLRGVWVNQFIDHASTAPSAIGSGTATAVRVTSEATVNYPLEGSKMMRWTDGGVVAGTDGFVSPDLNVDLYDPTNGAFEFSQVIFDIYYEDNNANVNLTDNTDLLFVLNDAADFSTASEWYITTDLTEKGWSTVTVDLTAAVSSGTALASQAGAPQFYGIKTDASLTNFANDDVLYVDNVRFSRGAASKSNQVYFEFSESVEITGDPAEGATGIAGSATASATTSGDMTTNKTFAGLGSFASGTLTTKTLTNTVAKSADGSMYAITLANRSGGLITSASPVTLSGLFTPVTPSADTVEDYAGNNVEAASTHTPETVIDTLDLTTAATAVTDFRTTLITGGQIRYGWTAPSQTAGVFSHYALLYGTSAGVTVASTLWDESNDAALSTAATNTTTVTGLTNGTTYYANLIGVDSKGIATTLVTEKSATPTGSGSTTSDSTAPSAPTGLTASINDSGQVVLAWTDPTATDLKNIDIAKSTGTGVDPNSILASVAKGVKTYTDTAVNLGDVVNYKLRAYDNTGNASSFSDTVSVTVAVAAPAEPLSLTLTAVGESGQSGTATLTEADGSTTVEVALTGATGTQNAHIHAGTCAETGAVAHALTDLTDGASTTVLAMTLAELEAEGPNYINVHDAADATVSTACGDLYAAAEAAPEEVVAPTNTVEAATADETGTVVEETTVQGADESAYATISAGTALTTADGEPFTGTFTAPIMQDDVVTPPADATVASDVYSIGSGDATVSITASQPVTVYLPVKAGFTASTSKVYKIFKVGSDEPSATCSVVTSEGATLFKCELTSFSDYVIFEFAAPVEEEVVEEDTEESPFTDISSHWAKDFIIDLYVKAIVTGKTSTTYAPNDDVTRAEFTKIIVGAFDIEMVSTTGSFTDISGHWGATYIEAAKAAGVTGGYSDKTFRPNAKITRAEALKIMLEAADVSFTAAAADFSDVKSSDWFAKYVNYASANDIVGGYADGTFGPNRNITRGEVAKIVSLMIAQ